VKTQTLSVTSPFFRLRWADKEARLIQKRGGEYVDSHQGKMGGQGGAADVHDWKQTGPVPSVPAAPGPPAIASPKNSDFPALHIQK